MTYEEAYAELQAILERVESQALSLTELKIALQRAADLLAFCKQALHDVTKDLPTL